MIFSICRHVPSIRDLTHTGTEKSNKVSEADHNINEVNI